MTIPPGKPSRQLAKPPTPRPRPRPDGPLLLPGPADPEFPAGRTSPASRGPARPYAALALARLAEMIDDPDPKVAFPACREILDRAWGKAEAGGPGEETRTIVVREENA